MRADSRALHGWRVVPVPFRLARMLGCVLVSVLTANCDAGGSAGSNHTSDAGARTKPRTVSFQLLRTGERALTTDASGAVSYAPVKSLGGVEVCVSKRRSAFALLQPFEPLTPPICVTDAPGKPVRLQGVPANSDLLVTHTKAGYRPLLTTFRTDEFNVAIPAWADNAMYFTPLLRNEASLPVEAAPPAKAADGLLAIWVDAIGDYGTGPAGALFGSEGDPGTAQADKVNVTITDANAKSIVSLRTRRDRPLFVSLPAGSYRLHFTHPLMELAPAGIQEQFMTLGLPMDTPNDIEVVVAGDHLTLASIDGFCPLPVNPRRGFTDIASCTIEADADAGAP